MRMESLSFFEASLHEHDSKASLIDLISLQQHISKLILTAMSYLESLLQQPPQLGLC